jgi:hypothetical protein
VSAMRGRGAEPPLAGEQRRGEPGRARVPADSCSACKPARLASRAVVPRPAGPRRRRERARACPPAALRARSVIGKRRNASAQSLLPTLCNSYPTVALKLSSSC